MRPRLLRARSAGLCLSRPQGSPEAAHLRLLAAVSPLLLAFQLAYGQGTFAVLNTGSGQPLASEVRQVQVNASLLSPTLRFDFGFATDESFSPGTFLDSFTVSIQDTNRGLSAFFLTADASGVVWAPTTPGAIPINGSGISAVPISYPGLQPVLANQHAFSFSAPVPAQFFGQTINMFFDLADNLDSTRSQGWFNNLRVTEVPEPRSWTLLVLVLLSRWILIRKRS